MNKIKNDLPAVSQNFFYPDKDSQGFDSQISTPKETGNPNDHPIQNNTSPFIVDWQLPGMGMGDINESYT